MTIEEFDDLSEQSKHSVIFDAQKVGERQTDVNRFELFKSHDFFIEVKTSLHDRIRHTITSYVFKNIPPNYIGITRIV